MSDQIVWSKYEWGGGAPKNSQGIFFETDDSDKDLYDFDPSAEFIYSLLTIENCFRELLGLDNEKYIKEDEHTHNSSEDIKHKKTENKLRKSEKNRSSLIKAAIREGEWERTVLPADSQSGTWQSIQYQ